MDTVKRIDEWVNATHSKIRLCDERDQTSVWQTEVIRVRHDKDHDGTPTTVLLLENGYSLRLIHEKLDEET